MESELTPVQQREVSIFRWIATVLMTAAILFGVLNLVGIITVR